MTQTRLAHKKTIKTDSSHNQHQAHFAQTVLKKLNSLYPKAKTELKNWTTPFQFLICVILSAQTTDKQVNKVTSPLFTTYPDAKTLSKATKSQISDIIRTVNYHKNKSRYIIETAQIIEQTYDSKPPKSLNQLITLPGVGRKTANVFLGEIYQKPDGIAVDTHVARVTQRLKLTSNSQPLKIANDLETIFSRNLWYTINPRFVLFGRYICTSRSPRCTECPLAKICPRFSKHKYKGNHQSRFETDKISC